MKIRFLALKLLGEVNVLKVYQGSKKGAEDDPIGSSEGRLGWLFRVVLC